MKHCFKAIFVFLCSCYFIFAQEWERIDECQILAILPHKVTDIEEMDIALSAECEPITTVAGCVNVLSGHFFQVEQDLIGNTIDPLKLTRYYDSANGKETFLGVGFGSQFPLFASDIQEGARHVNLMISERDGFLIPYKGKSNQRPYTCQIDPRLLKEGYTNLNRVGISSHANFVNWQVLLLSNKWVLRLGDGTERTYERPHNLESQARRRLDFPTNKIYLLTEEKKPNGNKVYFDYRLVDYKPCLSKVWTTNRTGITFNSLDIFYSSTGCKITSSCGNSTDYAHEMERYSGRLGLIDANILKKVDSRQHGTISYQSEKDYPPRIVKVLKPNACFLKVHYNKSDKVESLHAPLGPKGAIIPTHTFQYEKNCTQVLDALGQLTAYRFDSNQRLSQIDTFDGSNIVRQEVFNWSTEEGEEGWLKAKSLQLNGNIYYVKTYTYDRKGNIINQSLYGNLTGEKNEAFTLSQKKERDHYSVDYEYSQDEYNLLVRKTTPEGLVISYEYFPGTNLRTKELHSYQGKIQERFFREYDDNGQVHISIEDDGSSQKVDDLTDVTFRRVKTVAAKRNSKLPSFGKSKRIVESYLDNGQLIPLKQTEFFYDAQGNENGQKVYDGKGNFCYETTKTYNHRGLLIGEINALGEVKTYGYDDNNNKDEEVHEGGRTIRNRYDFGHRLRRKEETHQSGEKFVTHYKYNALNQLVAEIDPYKHQTDYKYDRLGRQIQIIKPMNEEGKNPTITKEYNLLDQVVSETDENGLIKKYAYNTYGSLTKITYPDGSIERSVYFPCGWLKQKWDANGTSIAYTYDSKGRILKESTKDAMGVLIKEEEWTYKGPLVQTKKDAMGVITTYFYDKAGRKIKEVCGPKVIRYQFDDLGRIITSIRALDDNQGQCTVYAYDWMDRVTSKTLQDCQGNSYAKETYEYDLYNNLIKKSVWQNEDKIATNSFHYDSDNSLIWKEDPYGNRTTHYYNHHHKDGAGHQVQCRAIRDPLNRSQHEADNYYHQPVRTDILEGNQQVACTHYSYDLAGHLIKEQATVMQEGKILREYTLLRTYDKRGFLESESEMPAGKTTSYVYKKGRLDEKKLPKGYSIHYEYDSLGRLKKIHSSDQSVAYVYQYDLHDNLIQIDDLVNQTTQTRTFDLYQRLILEEIAPGIELTYEYDNLDRMTKMTLPDKSHVTYTYDPFHLKEIQRYKNDLLKYVCKCSSYDWQGNLLKSTSPAGEVHYTFDFLGRAIKIESPHWKAYLEEFDLIGNLKKATQQDPTGELKGKYAYDRFDHLSSESNHQENRYIYDSLGNCVKKNKDKLEINDLNQVDNDVISNYSYDLNGNLISQTNPPVSYTYDALNRLISLQSENGITSFVYDSFGRCLKMIDSSGSKYLLYQDDREIGSMQEGKIQELRLLHPQSDHELTFALELREEAFFPLQDHRHNICALQKGDGSLAQWYRYTAFGSKAIYGEENLVNPWCFANRRETEGLLLFAHRFYNPALMRWQTTDPLGFEDGLNLYTYVHNNPFVYKDPDGRFVVALPLVIPFLVGTFGTGGLILAGEAVGAVAGIVIGTALSCAVYETCKALDHVYNDVDTETREKEWEKRDEREQKRRGQTGGTPRSREAQDKQADDAKKEIEDRLGRKLTKKEHDRFHGHVTKQGYNYQELVDEGYWLFCDML